ncbi:MULTISPECIES: sodium-dependent transporter [Clostridium]|uniref:Sodium-dependent transporter n=1 Tax=Clostridium cibarium TaxID=2762247 RepID=A0ABR8PU42_9CLOT|nr:MULTISPECIES: sodium-dependent transporter [Clostridium]MBD7911662.1 sodium-dependent transporter [Clostridium cibarium]
MEKQRERFSSSLTAFLATLSSAVGLGNIWMFPYMVGENGGAAFIIVYLCCVFFIGLPTLISEFSIGRGTRKNLLGATKIVTENRVFRSVGIIGIIASYSILFFYTVVGGWVYSYVFKSIIGTFRGITAEGTAEIFRATTLSMVEPIAWQLAIVIVASIILAFGVKSGIEKITKVAMPLLVILLIICAGRSLTLSGAIDGIVFLLKPDFSKISFEVVLTALGLAFLKLSIGTGSMTTYSSYFTSDNSLIGTGTKLAFADTGVSLLAGLAIFPAVFSFGLEPTGGPGLLFNTLPLIFEKVPGGEVLLVIFFMLTAMAATMATISIIEVLIATFIEEFKFTRRKAIIINLFIIMFIGSLTALSVGEGALLAEFKIFNYNLFDLFDVLTSKVLLPLNGLLFVILCGHFVKKEYMKKELTNDGLLNNKALADSVYFNIKYITPVLIIIVFIKTFI